MRSPQPPLDGGDLAGDPLQLFPVDLLFPKGPVQLLLQAHEFILMRFHSQTAGVSLTAQEPLNNIARTAFEALAAILGGTQSLHTNSFDEALALPTEQAVRIAVRTQQIAALETGAANTADPLGGSYFVEALTDEMERQAYDYFKRIDEMGGVVKTIENGFQMYEIAEASARYQREIEEEKRYIVNVNIHEPQEETDVETHRVSQEVSDEQIRRLKELKQRRDNEQVEDCLKAIKKAAEEARTRCIRPSRRCALMSRYRRSATL